MASLFYTTGNVCELLHISTRTIDRYRKRERNPFPAPYIGHVGSENLYLAAEVDAWIVREHERTVAMN